MLTTINRTSTPETKTPQSDDASTTTAEGSEGNTQRFTSRTRPRGAGCSPNSLKLQLLQQRTLELQLQLYITEKSNYNKKS
jgi:hypothetical protein